MKHYLSRIGLWRASQILNCLTAGCLIMEWKMQVSSALLVFFLASFATGNQMCPAGDGTCVGEVNFFGTGDVKNLVRRTSKVLFRRKRDATINILFLEIISLQTNCDYFEPGHDSYEGGLECHWEVKVSTADEAGDDRVIVAQVVEVQVRCSNSYFPKYGLWKVFANKNLLTADSSR